MFKNNMYADRAKRLKYFSEYNKKRRESERKRLALFHTTQRKEIIDLLGGKCSRCGFDDYRALQIDHVEGGGRKEIESLKSSYLFHVIKEIKAGSKKYQCLCANCNWIKKWENKEVGKYLENKK
jgi:hypothetical protein